MICAQKPGHVPGFRMFGVVSVAKGSTTERGYGYAHRRIRQALLAELVPGTPCPRCQQPMHPAQLLDLDHTDDRRGYNGLAHRSCNRSAGAHKRNAARTSTTVTSRAW